MDECVTWGTEKRALTVFDYPLYTNLCIKRVSIDRVSGSLQTDELGY